MKITRRQRFRSRVEVMENQESCCTSPRATLRGRAASVRLISQTQRPVTHIDHRDRALIASTDSARWREANEQREVGRERRRTVTNLVEKSRRIS